MKQQTTPAIVLRRTNYAEADRIVTFLTPIGKVKAIVKGVRRSKSKLAGGIELFSESTITFLETRGNLARIVSTRLDQHWDGIIGDLQRMMFGYETMKLIDKAIEDDAERGYFDLLRSTLTALGDLQMHLSDVEVWFYVRFLELLGYGLNLKTTASGQKLSVDELYTFEPETMSFEISSAGSFRAEHIKFLRLCINHQPAFMKQVKDSEQLTESLKSLLILEAKRRTTL